MKLAGITTCSPGKSMMNYKDLIKITRYFTSPYPINTTNNPTIISHNGAVANIDNAYPIPLPFEPLLSKFYFFILCFKIE
jgi:hypothetical protein